MVIKKHITYKITPRFDQQYSDIAHTLRQTDGRTDETTHNTCFTQHSWRAANKRLSITFGYGCIFPGVKLSGACS